MTRPPRPFVSWMDMETICGCPWGNCRHKRRQAAENLERRVLSEQVDALTDADIAWLRDMGWDH